MQNPTNNQPNEDDTMRIARYLARCGVASRRKSEDVVSAGRVTLNGEVITDLGRQVKVGVDQVQVDGKPIAPKQEHLTIAVNKPVGVLVTRSDPEGRKTVYNLLPAQFKTREAELVYCGRLDFYSAGLLIMTTDGDLAHQMMHPRHHVSKTYVVATNQELTEEEISGLQSGVEIDGYQTRDCEIEKLSARDNEYRYQMTLHEGRNRQIRKMIESTGKKVAKLERVAIGQLLLRELKLRRGDSTELTAEQLRLAQSDS